MPRPRDLAALPDHPAVISNSYLTRFHGKSRMVCRIRCPRCLAQREITVSDLRKEAKRVSFMGYCRACSIASVKDGSHRWMNARRKPKTAYLHPSGYAQVSPFQVEDHLLPMYRAMQKSGQPVLEHRWVMAKHLGRALRSNELVDHMNGGLADNAITNLRLYIRGKQQPGSAPGHGTYYHEWQMAERRIQELEATLATLLGE